MILKDLSKVFHFLPHDLIGKQKPLKTEIKGFKLGSAKLVKLLGINTDYNLAFDTRVFVRLLVRKCRIRNGLDEKQVKLLFNYHFVTV